MSSDFDNFVNDNFVKDFCNEVKEVKSRSNLNNNSNIDKAVYFQCVINVPLGQTIDFVKDKIVANSFIFAKGYVGIIHNKDLKTLDTTQANALIPVKTEHIHLLLDFKRQSRISQVIKYCSEYYGLPENCISVRVCYNRTAFLVYCTHYNEPHKTKYPVSDFFYSDYIYFLKVFSNDYDKVIDNYVIQCFRECNSMTELISRLGWKLASKVAYMFYNYRKDYIDYEKN